MEKINQSIIKAINSTKPNQFNLQMKNLDENSYSENTITIEDGQLKYFKTDRPNISYTLSLIDIAITDKSLDNKNNHKLFARSVTKSFTDKIFKHKDEKYLKFFRDFLEKAIIEEKSKKNKKQEIIVKITKEDKSHIKSSSTIKENEDNKMKTSSRIFNQFSKVIDVSDGKKTFYNLVCNLKDFQMEERKYQNIFKSNYKFFKNSKGVLTATDDGYKLIRKLNEENIKMNKNEKSNFETITNLLKSKNLEFHSIFQNLSVFLIILLICLNVYFQKYGNILYSSFIFIITVKSISNKYRNGETKPKVTNNFQETKYFHIMSETNINADIANVVKLLTNYFHLRKWNKYLKNVETVDKNENMKFNLKYSKYSEENYFSQFELSECEFKIFHNVNENKIYAVQIFKTSTEEENALNIFEFKSNEKFSKTKITVYSVIREDYPGFYVESVTKLLSNLKNFLNHEMPNLSSFKIADVSSRQIYEGWLIKSLYKTRDNKEQTVDIAEQNKSHEDDKKTSVDFSNNTGNNNSIKIQNENIQVEQKLPLGKQDERFHSLIDLNLPKPFLSQTNFIKVNQESFKKLKEDTISLIAKSSPNNESIRLSDDYLIDILTGKNYISYSDTNINSDDINNNILFIKQHYTKKDNRKIYKAKIKMEFNIEIVVNYLKRVENRLKFNKYLKDILILHIDDKFHVEYQVMEYKLFSKLRDFVLINDYRVINWTERKIQIISSNSFENDSNYFNKLVDNCERGFIKSSGYYFEELGAPNTCKLGFWIECEISNDLHLEEHVLKDYLNHLLEIRENMIFDFNK